MGCWTPVTSQWEVWGRHRHENLCRPRFISFGSSVGEKCITRGSGCNGVLFTGTSFSRPRAAFVHATFCNPFEAVISQKNVIPSSSRPLLSDGSDGFLSACASFRRLRVCGIGEQRFGADESLCSVFLRIRYLFTNLRIYLYSFGTLLLIALVIPRSLLLSDLV
jgi:hypothetical protein